MLTMFEMRLAQISNDYKVHGDIDYEDIEWLIAQAEELKSIKEELEEES